MVFFLVGFCAAVSLTSPTVCRTHLRCDPSFHFSSFLYAAVLALLLPSVSVVLLIGLWNLKSPRVVGFWTSASCWPRKLSKKKKKKWQEPFKKRHDQECGTGLVIRLSWKDSSSIVRRSPLGPECTAHTIALPVSVPALFPCCQTTHFSQRLGARWTTECRCIQKGIVE